MIHVTEENLPLLSSIIKKCHDQHVIEREKKRLKFLSPYMYNYSITVETPKEMLAAGLIKVTDDERRLIDSWEVRVSKYNCV